MENKAKSHGIRLNGRQTPFFIWRKKYTYIALFSTDETCIAIATSNETEFNYISRRTRKYPVLLLLKHFIAFIFSLSVQLIKRGESDYVNLMLK